MKELHMPQEKFKLGIIDENEAEVKGFFQYFDKDFIPVEIELGDDKKAIIEDIVTQDVDAVVIDYRLMERARVKITFNGNELLQYLNDTLPKFPAVIMTNYPPDAKNHNVDPFRVFGKEVMEPDKTKKKNYEAGLDLIESINILIKNYKEELKKKENRLIKLLDKKKKAGKLSLREEEERIELDDFLEKSLNKRNKIPRQLKGQHASELRELIIKTDELINKIKEKRNA